MFTRTRICPLLTSATTPRQAVQPAERAVSEDADDPNLQVERTGQDRSWLRNALSGGPDITIRDRITGERVTAKSVTAAKDELARQRRDRAEREQGVVSATACVGA